MLFEDLTKFGLDEKEAKVYLALLELGEANVEQISKKSGVKRTTVYDILDSLKEKQLLGQINKDKKVLFFAEDPRKIEESLDEKKGVFHRILPELLSISNLIDKKPKIRFFEGADGIRSVYRDTLKYPDQELLAWVCEEAIHHFDPKFLNDYYISQRLAKKIWVRAIAPNLPEMQEYKGLDQKALRRTRLFDKGLDLDIEINLYGKNKIGLMSFEEKFGLIIESEKIFNTLRSIFEMNWNSLPEK